MKLHVDFGERGDGGGLLLNGLTSIVWDGLDGTSSRLKVSSADELLLELLGEASFWMGGDRSGDWELDLGLAIEAMDLTVEDLNSGIADTLFYAGGKFGFTLGITGNNADGLSVYLKSIDIFPFKLADYDDDGASNLYKRDALATDLLENMSLHIMAGDFEVIVNDIDLSGSSVDAVKAGGTAEWDTYYTKWNEWASTYSEIKVGRRCKPRVCWAVKCPDAPLDEEALNCESCSQECSTTPPVSPVDRAVGTGGWEPNFRGRTYATTGLSVGSYTLLDKVVDELIIETGSIDISNGEKLSFTASSSRVELSNFEVNQARIALVLFTLGKDMAKSFDETDFNETDMANMDISVGGMDLDMDVDFSLDSFSATLWNPELVLKEGGRKEFVAKASWLNMRLNDVSVHIAEVDSSAKVGDLTVAATGVYIKQYENVDGVEKQAEANIASLFMGIAGASASASSLELFGGGDKAVNASLESLYVYLYGMMITSFSKDSNGREWQMIGIGSLVFGTGASALRVDLSGDEPSGEDVSINGLKLLVTDFTSTRTRKDASENLEEIATLNADKVELGIGSITLGSFKKFSFARGPFEVNGLGLYGTEVNDLSLSVEGVYSRSVLYGEGGGRAIEKSIKELASAHLKADRLSIRRIESASFDGNASVRGGSLLFLTGSSVTGLDANAKGLKFRGWLWEESGDPLETTETNIAEAQLNIGFVDKIDRISLISIHERFQDESVASGNFLSIQGLKGVATGGQKHALKLVLDDYTTERDVYTEDDSGQRFHLYEAMDFAKVTLRIDTSVAEVGGIQTFSLRKGANRDSVMDVDSLIDVKDLFAKVEGRGEERASMTRKLFVGNGLSEVLLEEEESYLGSSMLDLAVLAKVDSLASVSAQHKGARGSALKMEGLEGLVTVDIDVVGKKTISKFYDFPDGSIDVADEIVPYRRYEETGFDNLYLDIVRVSEIGAFHTLTSQEGYGRGATMGLENVVGVKDLDLVIEDMWAKREFYDKSLVLNDKSLVLNDKSFVLRKQDISTFDKISVSADLLDVGTFYTESLELGNSKISIMVLEDLEIESVLNVTVGGMKSLRRLWDEGGNLRSEGGAQLKSVIFDVKKASIDKFLTYSLYDASSQGAAFELSAMTLTGVNDVTGLGLTLEGQDKEAEFVEYLWDGEGSLMGERTMDLKKVVLDVNKGSLDRVHVYSVGKGGSRASVLLLKDLIGIIDLDLTINEMENMSRVADTSGILREAERRYFKELKLEDLSGGVDLFYSLSFERGPSESYSDEVSGSTESLIISSYEGDMSGSDSDTSLGLPLDKDGMSEFVSFPKSAMLGLMGLMGLDLTNLNLTIKGMENETNQILDREQGGYLRSYSKLEFDELTLRAVKAVIGSLIISSHEKDRQNYEGGGALILKKGEEDVAVKLTGLDLYVKELDTVSELISYTGEESLNLEGRLALDQGKKPLLNPGDEGYCLGRILFCLGEEDIDPLWKGAELDIFSEPIAYYADEGFFKPGGALLKQGETHLDSMDLEAHGVASLHSLYLSSSYSRRLTDGENAARSNSKQSVLEIYSLSLKAGLDKFEIANLRAESNIYNLDGVTDEKGNLLPRKKSHVTVEAFSLTASLLDVGVLTLASDASFSGLNRGSLLDMKGLNVTNLDLGIDKLDSKTKLYYKESGKLRKDSHLTMDRLDLDVAWGSVGGLSMGSVSREEGEDESSFTYLESGKFKGFDLGIDDFDSKTKLYYKESEGEGEGGNLREDSHLTMDRLDLDVAWGTVSGLTLASASSIEGVSEINSSELPGSEISSVEVTGEEASFARLEGAEFGGFDLGIDEFDSKTKLYYKESGKLRKDSHLKMDRVDLDIAWGDVTGLTLASGSSGEGEDEASFTRMETAEFRGFDLGIDDFDSKTKLYYKESEGEGGNLREDSHLTMDRLDLDVAWGTVSGLTLASASSIEGVSEINSSELPGSEISSVEVTVEVTGEEASFAHLEGAEFRGFDLGIDEFDSKTKLYYKESGKLRKDSHLKMDRLDLDVAWGTVSGLALASASSIEGVSEINSSELPGSEISSVEVTGEEASFAHLEGAEFRVFDLGIDEFDSKTKLYYKESGKLRKDSHLKMDRVDLDIAWGDVTGLTLASGSSGEGEDEASFTRMETAEFRGFDLGIDDFDSKTKLYYKESGKLRKDSHLKMGRVDLDIAWGDVTGLTLASGSSGEGEDEASFTRMETAEFRGFDLGDEEDGVEAMGFDSETTLYYEEGGKRSYSHLGMERLSLDIAWGDVTGLTLASSSSGEGEDEASFTRMETAEFRGFDLGIDEFDSKTKLYYKESGKLRKDSHLKMDRVDLDIAWGDVTGLTLASGSSGEGGEEESFTAKLEGPDSGAEFRGFVLGVDDFDSEITLYYKGGGERRYSHLKMEKHLDLNIAWGGVKGLSLGSSSSKEGEGEESFVDVAGAEFRGFVLGIGDDDSGTNDIDSKTKLYYEESEGGKLKEDSHLKIRNRLDLDIAWGKMDGLSLVSTLSKKEEGGESLDEESFAAKLEGTDSGLEIRVFDLVIGDFDREMTLYYKESEGGKLKEDSHLKMDLLDLDIAWGKMEGLSLESTLSVEEGYETSFVYLENGEFRVFELGIDGFDSETTLYYKGGGERRYSHLEMGRLDLDIAWGSVAGLEFASSSGGRLKCGEEMAECEEYASDPSGGGVEDAHETSFMYLEKGEFRDFNLVEIDDFDSETTLYYKGGGERSYSHLEMERLGLDIAWGSVAGLEFASSSGGRLKCGEEMAECEEYASDPSGGGVEDAHETSFTRMETAKFRGFELDIYGEEDWNYSKTELHYDESGNLKKDNRLKMKSLDLDIPWGDVTGLTLDSTSSSEGGYEASFVHLEEGEFRGFDLGIDEFDSETKLYYKGGGGLRKDSHLYMSRLDLDIAWGTVTGLGFASSSGGRLKCGEEMAECKEYASDPSGGGGRGRG